MRKKIIVELNLRSDVLVYIHSNSMIITKIEPNTSFAFYPMFCKKLGSVILSV